MLANVGREGQSVSTYVLKMKAYLDQMEHLGYPMPLVLGVNMILTSLSKDYDQFVQNYNMHGMGKTIPELHAMLKLAEKGILKKTPAILAIRQGQIHGARESKEAREKASWIMIPSTRSPYLLKRSTMLRILSVTTVTRLDTRRGTVLYICNKKTKHNLDSTFLWHCRLGHINKKHIEKLQHDGLLESIDDESFDVCVSYISGKMARKPFTHASESADNLLGITHSDVCGPFRTTSREESAARILNMVPTKKVYKELHMKLWAWENPNSVLLGSLGCESALLVKETHQTNLSTDLSSASS
ncbi:retrotransposon protein, putative, ty1-copia subclass [Tanacetum coccineum]